MHLCFPDSRVGMRGREATAGMMCVMFPLVVRERLCGAPLQRGGIFHREMLR